MPRARPETITKAGLAQLARKLACKFEAGGGGVAGTDDRDHRPKQGFKRTANAKQGRRVVERGEMRRVESFLRSDQLDAELMARFKLGKCLVLAADTHLACRAAASRKLMESLQRRASASELLQQDAERARPDVIAADQAQAVDPLGVGQFSWLVDGVHALSRAHSMTQPEVA
jgi:hypothetical protein